MSETIKTLSEALSEYQEATSKREAGEVGSAIKRHILSNLPRVLNLKELQHYNPKQVLNQIPIAGFVAIADPILQEALRHSLQKRNTVSVKKSKWGRFCKWLKDQPWYVPDPTPKEDAPAQTPFNTHIARGTLEKVKALKKKRKVWGKFRWLETDWTPAVRSEFQSFDQFCTTVSEWRKTDVSPATLKRRHEGIERILGFQKQQGVPPEQLSLKQLLDPSVLKAYEKWSRDRGVASSTIKTDVGVVILIAQWVFSQSYPTKDWRNSESVKTVRGYVNAVVDLGDRPHASQDSFEEREISMDQCWEMLKYLGWRCKDMEKQYGVTKEVVDAWMDYLLLAVLITTGARQREERELRFKNISIEPNGEAIVTLPPQGHKTGRKTGKRRVYPLFVGSMQQELTADLFYYRDHIRPQNLKHDYVFFIRRSSTTGNKYSRRGDPIKTGASYLSHLVPSTVAVVTAHLYGVENARWTAPHDFRRIIATWVCTYGEPEDLAVYAELLGHRLEEMVGTYNKMHPGKLARQASLSYKNIAAREARVKAQQQAPRSAHPPDTVAQMSEPELIKALHKFGRKLWNALTPRKQDLLLQSLTSIERELLEDEFG